MLNRCSLPYALTVCAMAAAAEASAEPMVVSYISKPPYYYTEAGQAKGFLLERSREMFRHAGIEPQFEERPAKRILSEMEQAQEPTCSIGWFKNPEREKFARFSVAIHQDQPMAVLTHADRAAKVRQHKSLQELTENLSLRLVVTDGYSYGPYIDNLIATMGRRVERASVSPVTNLRKVGVGFVDYAIVDVDELTYLRQMPELKGLKLETVPFPDIPAGNVRYIMCARTIGVELMQRINTAIQTVFPNKP